MNSTEFTFGRYITKSFGILSEATVPALGFGTASIAEGRKCRSVLACRSMILISYFIEVHHLLKIFLRYRNMLNVCSNFIKNVNKLILA
jgi:hypothetical protein